MINNRQAGRRRGRGGGGNNGQRQGNPGRADNGSRIDNRARGNANQLYEKYKNLAADAQRQGDRVNTEYYLQFADHYFRVLSESRSRFEDQPRRQRDDFDGADEEFGDEGEPIRAGDQAGREDQQRDRHRDRDTQRVDAREGRGHRASRDNGQPGEGASGAAEPFGRQMSTESETAGEQAGRAPQAVPADDEAPQPRRRGRPRRSVEEDGGAGTAGGEPTSNGVEADRLPPALTAAANDADDMAGEAKPRRRRSRAPAAETSSAAE